MSGGSYDYTCYEMSDGRVDKAIANADRALADFDEFAQEGLKEVWEDNKRREPTEREKLLADAGIVSMRRSLVAFVDAAKKLSEQAQQMSELFKTLEWIRSYDRGPQDLHDDALKWALERLK